MDARRLPAGGVLTLGEQTPANEYTLEVQAVDGRGRTMSTGWTEFELR